MSGIVSKTFYLRLKILDAHNPAWSGFAAPTVTTNKPGKLGRHEIAFKLRIEVPVSYFKEFIPSGTIVIPEDAPRGTPEIEIEVPEGVEIGPATRLRLLPYDPGADD